jgi:hypothetical protein
LGAFACLAEDDLLDVESFTILVVGLALFFRTVE